MSLFLEKPFINRSILKLGNVLKVFKKICVDTREDDIIAMNESIEIFCCYAREDHPLQLKLRTHLASLERESSLNIWHDMDISPGTKWKEEITEHLNTAHIILLLISPDFMASEYCYSKEMKQAMERHARREALVIPILLRPVRWQKTPFGELQVLPYNGRAVTEWRIRDQAFLAIAQGIEQVTKEQLTLSMASSQGPQSTINTTRLHPDSMAGIGRRDWGEAPDVPVFFGRTKEHPKPSHSQTNDGEVPRGIRKSSKA